MSGFKRRQLFSYLAAASAGGLVGFAAGRAQARKPHVAPGPGGRYVDSRVSVTIEHADGTPFEDFWAAGSRYVAGEIGERYNIRITNHAAHRVETVVTVDGRDVVSGEVGDFIKQRGYVIPAYGSVVIDGFRQSLTHAATFRFSRVQDGYSSRKGTPQHSGVIGVAVFDEKPRPVPKYSYPVTPEPDPYPYNYDYDDRYPTWDESRRHGPASGDAPAAGRSESASRPRDASEDSARPSSASKRKSSRRGGAGHSDAARGQAQERGAAGGNLGTAGPSSYRRPAPDYAAPPREPEHLGTEYGESRYSRVREVSFKRRNANKPDAMLTLYYDSYAALRARGVIVEPPPPPRPYVADPQPWPQRRFAQPPPPRRY